MRFRPIYLVAALAVMSGCASSSSAPNSPSTPTLPGVIDIMGIWTQVGGDSRTWTISQYKFQAGGESTLSESNTPVVGSLSGRGGVLGTAAFGAFNFAETYDQVSTTSYPPPNSCSLGTSEQLAVNGTTMVGTVTASLTCPGGRLAQFTRNLVMQKQ